VLPNPSKLANMEYSKNWGFIKYHKKVTIFLNKVCRMLQLPNYKLMQFVQMHHNTFFAAISLQREHPYPLRAA